MVKNPSAMQDTPVRFQEDPLEKGWATHSSILGLPSWLSWLRICPQCGRPEFDPWVGKIPWRRERLPTPVFWPGEFHGLYSPWDCKESDMTERLSLSLSSHEQVRNWNLQKGLANLFFFFGEGPDNGILDFAAITQLFQSSMKAK